MRASRCPSRRSSVSPAAIRAPASSRGCNTLNADAGNSVAAEVGRTLVRSGVSQADADKASQALQQRYGESNRDAMRRIFANVPVIYGFSSLAPLGASAGPMLGKYFQS